MKETSLLLEWIRAVLLGFSHFGGIFPPGGHTRASWVHRLLSAYIPQPNKGFSSLLPKEYRVSRVVHPWIQAGHLLTQV